MDIDGCRVKSRCVPLWIFLESTDQLSDILEPATHASPSLTTLSAYSSNDWSLASIKWTVFKLSWGEVRRIHLPRTRVNKIRPIFIADLSDSLHCKQRGPPSV